MVEGGRVILVTIVVLLTSCTEALAPRPCAKDGDCLQGGRPGTCLVAPSGTKWCSFEAGICGSGRQWGLLAGDGLAGTCVGPVGPGLTDAPFTDGGPPDSGVPSGPSTAVLAPEAPAFDFGAIPRGTPVSHPFVFANVGALATGPLAVTLTGTDAAAFTLDPTGCRDRVIPSGESCTVKILS